VVRRGVGAEGRKGEKWEAVVGAAMARGAGDRGGDEAAANRTEPIGPRVWDVRKMKNISTRVQRTKAL
jgi:hypothetical protein